MMNTSLNYDDIKTRVREIIQQITNLDDSKLDDDTLFVDELQLDSLVLLEIAVTVDKEYRLGLTEEEMLTFGNIVIISRLVDQKLAEKSE